MKERGICKRVCEAVFDVGKTDPGQIRLNGWKTNLIREPRGKIT